MSERRTSSADAEPSLSPGVAQPAPTGPATSEVAPAAVVRQVLPTKTSKKSLGYGADVWRRYRKSKLGLLALTFVALLTLIAIFSPAIVGTKPVLCKYKGRLSMPAVGYYLERWEDGLNVAQELRKRYTPERL